MRHLLKPWLALAPLVVLAACAPPRPDPRGVRPEEVLLQVSATGQADTTPDQARFQIGVSSIGADAQAATAANNAKMQAVMAALKALGVTDADVQTRQLTVARQDWGPNKGKFEANNVVEVRVRDVAKAGPAIAAATQAGVNVMWGPNLSIADPEASGRSAYAAAYKAARARAEAYAQAAGMKVARVLRISDVGGVTVPLPPMAAYEAMDQARVAAAPVAPPVMAGTSTQQVSVNVDFALAPK
ncbi:SIMPL domain-containing protein [Sphingomonas sp.]|uniref:SIMPL domain-containing protein n=1 Tax=Sphingomonas sp. TaxID=28214 RepID=UPI001B1C0BCA|nr:SIMPL domain-containing protein [Sphingomonas sp.]MBO9711965.1 SIMPL domain-containing protein [Sphingomonas sp.]